MIKKISKNDYIIYGLSLFLILVIYQVGNRVYRFQNLKKETKEASIPTVSIVVPKQFEGLESISLPGTIKPWNEALLDSQVSGYVKNWYKDYGDEVQKGTLLAEIQVPALDAEYSKAKADYDSQVARYQLATVTANRYLSLQKTNAVSDQAISEALAEQNSEKAKMMAIEKNWQKWQAMVNFKKIIAPFHGIITQRNINVGDFVNQAGNLSDPKSDGPLFVVAEIYKLRLFVSVPSAFSYLLKSGLSCEVQIPEFPNEVFVANYLTVAKGFDSSSQTVLAEFELPNPSKKILPGSYAQANIRAPISSPYLMVPASSLIYESKLISVATLSKKDKIHFKTVDISRILDGIVEIKSGIEENDRIIEYPRTSFQEGDSVRIVVPRNGY